ncbi:unnamed protein product [Ectocarpus sp. 6 AP-2014]
MELSSWTRGATNVALAHGTGIHPLCQVLEGGDRPQAARFPAWYGCHGGGENGTVVCSSAERLHEHRTSLSDEDWVPRSSTRNLRLKTDPTISSTWWAFEGQRETPRDDSNGVKGPGWTDCNGYYAFGGEVDSDRNNRGNMRRALEDEEVTSTELQVKLPAEQGSTEFGTSVKVTLEEETEERTDRFVHTAGDDCDPMWTSWPAVQEAAIANGTVLVFDIYASVGNLFLTFHSIIKAARLLEVALFLRWEKFEGFRAAFDSASIKWDLDPTTIVQHAEELTLGSSRAEVESLYPFKFWDGNLVLSPVQLETLAQQTGIPDASLAKMAAAVKEGWSSLRQLSTAIMGSASGSLQPCAWNMFLRRSPSMMASLRAHNPWTPSGFGPLPKDYVAWHIRTSDGESKEGFNPDVHTYVFHGQSPNTVFPIFQFATKMAEKKCPKIFHEDTQKMPVYISSNSKSTARNCTARAAEQDIPAGFVDLGIDDLDAHTAFSKDPNATAMNAFIDYLYLMDSSIIVQTGSSFSFTVASIKGLKCIGIPHPEELPVRRLIVCLPADC